MLSWDVRSLNTTMRIARVGWAVGSAGGGCEGIVSLSHHPTLRHVLCAQMASGRTVVVDAEATTVLAMRQCVDAQSPTMGEGATMAGEGIDTAQSSCAADWRVRCRRGAWMGGLGRGSHSGPEWWCCGLMGSPGLTVLRLNAHCTELSTCTVLPSSAPVVVVDAHPTLHYLAVGLQSNAIGLLAPIAHLPINDRLAAACEDERGLDVSTTAEALEVTSPALVGEATDTAPIESAPSSAGAGSDGDAAAQAQAPPPCKRQRQSSLDGFFDRSH